MVDRVTGVKAKFIIETDEKGGEYPERLPDGSGGWDLMWGADKGVGYLPGVIDHSTARDTPHDRYPSPSAALLIEDLAGLLETTKRQGRRFPAVNAEERP
jgi:hypothetical protein